MMSLSHQCGAMTLIHIKVDGVPADGPVRQDRQAVTD